MRERHHPFAAALEEMIRETIEARGVRDRALLEALRRVPRHEFIPASERSSAYGDHPLPIGFGQTISQPYMVASMTDLAAVSTGSKVLEIGTGSGYQAAVLAELECRVETFEIIEPLARQAIEDLERLGYADRVRVHIGDGYNGWPEVGPFDAVIVTAAPDHVPEPLVEQLAVGGRLVIPVGRVLQELYLIEKGPRGRITTRQYAVRFVPMTGIALKLHAA